MTLSRRSLLTLTSGLVVLAGAGAWWTFATPKPSEADAATTPAPKSDAAEPAAAKVVDDGKIKDFSLGPKDAKVQIHEFLSFTCPHCQHFHTEVFPKLKADYIDTGKASLTYHEVYFDQAGLLGAMVARCGGEMRYFGITDMLYDKQRDWAGFDDINASVEQLKKLARTAGMDDATVDACLRDQAAAESMVGHYQASIESFYPGDSFPGTPSFIINGTKYSNMAYEDMKKIIDAELAK